jgi:trigger factor
LSLEIVDVTGCKKNLVVEVPSDDVDGAINRLAREYAQRVKVPGFRPGKIPLHIVKQRFSAELRSEATQDIIQNSWKEAIEERGLQPLAEPAVENVQTDPGSPLKFTLTFEVMPELDVKDYKNIPVTLSDPKIEDSEIDKALEELREQQAQYIPVENDAIHDGHTVTLTLDGEFVGGGKPIHEDDVTLVVGDSRTNETFSENLRGANQGDIRTFEVTYPADHHRKSFAGKNVRYSVRVKEIKEKHLLELSDEFAVDLGAENLAALRGKISEDLVTKAKRAAEKKAREDVLDYLVERHRFDVPECLVREEQEDYARRITINLAQQGVDLSKTSVDWRKVFDEDRPRAEQAVRRSIILNSIAQQEGLEVSDEELDNEFQKLAEGTHRSAAAVRAQFEKDKRLQDFRAHLRHNKALDFIYRNANISGG